MCGQVQWVLSFWEKGVGGRRKWRTGNCSQGGFSLWCSPLILLKLYKEPVAGPRYLISASSLSASTNTAAAMPQPWNSACPADTHSFNTSSPSSHLLLCLCLFLPTWASPGLTTPPAAGVTALGWQWSSQQSLQRKLGQTGKQSLSAPRIYTDIYSNSCGAPCVSAGWVGRAASLASMWLCWKAWLLAPMAAWSHFARGGWVFSIGEKYKWEQMFTARNNSKGTRILKCSSQHKSALKVWAQA